MTNENDNFEPASDSNSSNRGGPEPRPSPSYEGSQGDNFRFPLWVKVVLLAAVVLLSALAYYSQRLAPTQKNASSPTALTESDPEEIAKRPKVNDFTLTDAEGKQQKLSDFKGNVVILSFWASWCTPCLLELPTFAEIEKRYHDRGLRVLAVNVDEGEQGKPFAHDFWAKESFKFPCFFDNTKQLEQQFEVDMLPSNFVIDREGRLAFSGFGANDWSNPQTRDFIESLLAEKPGDPAASAAEVPTEVPEGAGLDAPTAGASPKSH